MFTEMTREVPMKDVSKLRQQLIDVGRLQDERDIELFDAMSENAPEMIMMVYAASLSGVFVTEEDPNKD
jgi:hypothetical protein